MISETQLRWLHLTMANSPYSRGPRRGSWCMRTDWKHYSFSMSFCFLLDPVARKTLCWALVTNCVTSPGSTIFRGDIVLRKILVWTGMVLAGYPPAARLESQNAAPPSIRAVSSIAQSVSTSRALLDTYCVTCHNQKTAIAGLTLDKMDLQKVGENAPVWEKVVHKLRTRAMPPPGRTRPDASSYNSLITHLETELDRAAAAKPDPGRPAIHRLNRAE